MAQVTPKHYPLRVIAEGDVIYLASTGTGEKLYRLLERDLILTDIFKGEASATVEFVCVKPETA